MLAVKYCSKCLSKSWRKTVPSVASISYSHTSHSHWKCTDLLTFAPNHNLDLNRRMSADTNTQESSQEINSFLSRSFLDLEKIDENLFRSKTLWQFKNARAVYGGQLIGHSLVAASHGIPENQHVHSFHSYFMHRGTAERPILYHVDKTREGKTYCARSIKATQHGQTLFTMQASFKQEEPYKKVHQLQMPKVPFPDELKSYEETLELLKDESVISFERFNFGREWYNAFPIVAKWIEPKHFLYREPHYPKRRMWIKTKGHIGENLHPNIHKCSVGYMTDLYMLHTALMPLAPVNTRTIFQASLDHSMWFHSPCRADEWMLFEIESDHIGDGRAFIRGQIWDINGTHLTTVTQEGAIRDPNTKAKL